MKQRIRPGLYEQPLTGRLDVQLKEVADELKRIEELDAHEASVAFARLLHERLVHAFTSLPAAAFF